MSDRWTPERVEMLRELWLGGLTASKIATRLPGEPISRSAVIGKAHRLGLGRRAPSTRRNAQRGLIIRGSGANRRGTSTVSDMERAVLGHSNIVGKGSVRWASALPPDNPDDIPTIHSIDDLESRHCRYPIGDPREPGFGYCGHARIAGAPYCAGHAARCTMNGPAALAQVETAALQLARRIPAPEPELIEPA